MSATAASMRKAEQSEADAKQYQDAADALAAKAAAMLEAAATTEAERAESDSDSAVNGHHPKDEASAVDEAEEMVANEVVRALNDDPKVRLNISRDMRVLGRESDVREHALRVVR